ncbi:unnamed protein product [Sphenostylis stenocarpa]|uniref:Uncharacterized protein n=1 Tax=Sphenostylis stenocarpa TaxID=92480 RepID=A0AA86W2Q6_9FABA|nr:unnamed protein product [Sphenostylis stenocarpa]
MLSEDASTCGSAPTNDTCREGQAGSTEERAHNHRDTCLNPGITCPNIVAQLQPLSTLHGHLSFPHQLLRNGPRHIARAQPHVTPPLSLTNQ